jgi:peptide/nickel transport system ATP-binding protein
MLALGLLGLQPPGARRRGEAILHPRARAAGSKPAASVDLLSAAPAAIRAVRGREVAMIFQEPMTALNPVMRIGAQIEEAIGAHKPRENFVAMHHRVVQALERAALPDPELRAQQFPHQLSGGLRQRVMIAMALAAGPRLLIADEPTTALDVTVQKQILHLLEQLRDKLGLAMLFISHDLGVVAQVAHRVAVMYAGRIVEEGPVAKVLRQPLHPYTAGLLRAAPRLDGRAVEPIRGAVPRLDALPPGCAFAPRCPLYREACDVAMPDLRPPAAEHRARCILVP